MSANIAKANKVVPGGTARTQYWDACRIYLSTGSLCRAVVTT